MRLTSPSALTDDRLQRVSSTVIMPSHAHRPLGHRLGAKALLVARCFRTVRLPTGRKGPRRDRRPAARRGHRPHHGAGALDDPAVACGDLGDWIDFSPDASTVLVTWYDKLRELVVSHDWTSPQASSAESRYEAGDGWLSLPTAGLSRPAESRMARRTSMCSTCPRAGGRRPGKPRDHELHYVALQPRCEVAVRIGTQGWRAQPEQLLRSGLGHGHGKTDHSAHDRHDV